jgi:hypothetical protein
MTHVPSLLAIVLLSQSQPNPSPVPGALLIASIIGAVIDYKYKKAGGWPDCLGRVLQLCDSRHDCSAHRALVVVRLGSRPLENASEVSSDLCT